MWRRLFYFCNIAVYLIIFVMTLFWDWPFYLLLIFAPLTIIGFYDIAQKKNNILRNYPLVGHFRYMLLGIRPQIQQYFIETDQSGRPYNKETRQMVYQRAKRALDTLPFGTQQDVYARGFESINHSLAPVDLDHTESRIVVGGPQCSQPYNASRLNISAMSFGALSKNAVMALNRGAKIGGFAHNTGEGGLSPYHLCEGGDLTWQIGTAYFGCRTKQGHFDARQFKDKAQHAQVKMIEIKLSQGAKPAHGGILPGVKVSEEIAAIRGLEPFKDAISPPAHEKCPTPKALLEFVAELRELCGGKPVGFKLCIGHRIEFLGICKAMLETQIYPDFITIDGAEGGTGAAPLEFTDYIGTPLDDGLVFAYNCLKGIDLKKHIRLICSGKIASGFDMVSKMALGADMCNAARSMMFALGCVQSRRCNLNTCPTGVTSQDPERMYALVVDDKAPEVANFHNETIKSFLAILGAAGVNRISELSPSYIYRRINHATALHYDQIYEFLKDGQLLSDNLPKSFASDWQAASSDHFYKR